MIVQVKDNLAMAEKIVDRVIERIEGRGGGMETLTIEDTGCYRGHDGRVIPW